MKYIDIMPQLEKSGTKDLSTQIFAVVLFGTFPPPLFSGKLGQAFTKGIKS
jgi:hypothetical protein